jgi:hypothetical protein
MSKRLFKRNSENYYINQVLTCYDSPKLDPSVAEASRGQIDIGNRMASLAEQQFASSQKLVDRYAPMFDQLLQQNVQSGKTAEDRANQQWQHYQSNFQPLERQIASEAAKYDSEAEIARRTGRAAATVQKQSDAAMEQKQRQMAAMGVGPTSGRTEQTMTDQSNITALAKAGAINQERNNTKMTGMAMRQSAAQLGRGITGTSIAQAGMGLGAGQAAQGNMTAHTGQIAGAMAPATSLLQGASGAYGGAAQTGLGMFNAAHQSEMANANSTGAALGSVLGAAAIFAGSSEKTKKNVKPVDEEGAMQAIREVPAKEWTYKPGEGDGGTHIGPMAEGMQAAAGDQVAPGGKAIDLISAVGMQHAAMRSLDQRLAALEGGKAKGKPKGQPRFSMSMESLPL